LPFSPSWPITPTKRIIWRPVLFFSIGWRP
jgi:hypothetical protein